MAMTARQRRNKNRLNARKSCGPKSVEGKDISRANSMTHGHTAKVLTLPDENPNLVKAEADAWRESCQPENHDEQVLVDHLAVATVQLERLTKAEDAVIDDQARRAQVVWDYTQQNHLIMATGVLRLDPANAVVQLTSFCVGVSWRMAR